MIKILLSYEEEIPVITLKNVKTFKGAAGTFCIKDTSNSLEGVDKGIITILLIKTDLHRLCNT